MPAVPTARCARVTGAICLGCWLAAAPLAAQDTVPETGWDASLRTQLGAPNGFVQVGENQYPGDKLSLHGDLGIDLIEVLELDVGYRLTPRDRFRVALQLLFLDGSTTLSNDVFFNGTELMGGTHLDTRTNFPDFFRATALYERTLLPLGDRGTLSGRVGFTYVFLNFTLDGTITPDSPGHETKEDFQTQELPVPLLGLRLDYPWTERINLFGSLDGGYLPWVNSLRSEGGTVDLTQSNADLVLGVAYAWGPWLSVEGGLQYTYFVQHEKSREDNNLIQLADVALMLGVTHRF
jgi:hypothetical protein